MASKDRPGHPARRPAAKSLKEKRAAKKAKHAAHKVEGNRPVEKSLSHPAR